jgi:glucose/arabinose dehydrogenase
MEIRSRRAAGALIALAAAMLLPIAAFAQGFKVETVARTLEYPWALSFSTQGGLYFTGRGGKFSRFDPKSGAVSAITGLPAPRAEGEAGTLGMALDPDFAENGRVYICYSMEDANGGSANRLSRFKLVSQQLTAEMVLFDDMPGARYHNGCRVIMAPDGQHLFFSMGDAGRAGGAQDLNYRGGKIFRLNLDGSVPADNPFKDSAVWSLGHRNPQGLRFRPTEIPGGTDELWSTEHGPDTQDELNLIVKGGNYGWPTCRGTGKCPGIENYQAAKAEFDHNDTVATSDLIFYDGKAFPQWKDSILFVTLKTGRLYRITLDGDKVAKSEILIENKYGRLRGIAEGPDGAIYISTDNGEDVILRLSPK